MSAIVKLHTRKGTLLIPGVSFESNKLVIDGELEGDRLKELVRFLVAAEGSSLFWWGDLLVFLKQTKGLLFAEEATKQSDNPQRLVEAMAVCEHLKTRFKVSFAHHREAMVELRDVGAAEIWLRAAETNGWTVAICAERFGCRDESAQNRSVAEQADLVSRSQQTLLCCDPNSGKSSRTIR
jgi:hypothetical protein